MWGRTASATARPPTLLTPVKVGMALTAHKTVAMFMRYVHTEDDPIRQAAELVTNRRKTITGAQRAEEATA